MRDIVVQCYLECRDKASHTLFTIYLLLIYLHGENKEKVFYRVGVHIFVYTFQYHKKSDIVYNNFGILELHTYQP